MNISALVNPVPKEAALPRRSPSTHSISAPSPALSVAKLPTPPLSTHRNILPKRKRHDPKPLWAVREHELVDGETLQQSNLRQQSRPPAPTTPRPQSQPPTAAAAPPRPPSAHQNGPPSGNPIAQPPLATRELQGYERPVSNDSQVYDDISRKVCDFIWNSAVGNPTVRNAIAESPHTQLEVEARWGQIIDRSTQSRLRGVHDTECVVRQGAADTKFESTMTMDQHKRMNMYLNTQVQKSKVPNSMRASVDYHHTREIDMFYELDQEAFNLLPPLVQHLIRQSPTRQRIRVTKDAQTNNILRKIIKHRIANFEISSPQTEWDYRIGVNLEIEFPGSIESLTLAVEQGKTPETMQRKKDRMSYAWLGAYQVDLTQVVQGQNKNHELELELNSQVLLDNADNIDKNVANCFEPLINGMMNNLRVLSREITPAGPN